MRLSVFSDYSLRVLIYLGVQKDRLATISEIAAFYEISENHLMKVVHQLGAVGYIETVRGKGGGIRLGQEPKNISLGDVIRNTETDLALAECFTETSVCRIQAACMLKVILDEALTGMLCVLDKYTLDDIIVKPNNLIRFMSKRPEKI